MREISLDGKVTSLTSVDALTLEQKYFPSTNNNSDGPVDIEEFIVKLKELSQFSDERNEEIFQFLQSSCDRSEDCPAEFSLVECPTKEARTAVHQLIKKYFSLVIDSDTITVEGVQWVRLLPKHKAKKGAKKWRPQWPNTVPEYLHFILLKENVDTMTAITHLTKLLRIKQDSLRFAGTKDKRAVTAQWISAFRLRPSQLTRFNNMKTPLVRVGNYSYRKY